MKPLLKDRGRDNGRYEVRRVNRPVDDEAVLRRVARSHNLTDESYTRITRVLGRAPTLTEVGIFGVMFSEHCSYASSKIYLKTFPTKGKQVLVPAGVENAGAVDLGDGTAVVFKCESHNHPSAVEPVQGAATGVGGIIRDIFTMGARPIALFDSLRFGALGGHARTRFLLDGVVRGIADYGNCVGVPTVGGEIAFDDTYRENPLVNVMCIGVLSTDAIARGAARGIGNPVLYVGSSTGRDGLGGASFASRELSEGSDADRPAVQIGDPFTEKCLIEATLEALETGDVIGIQDMGAAGLTCSTCETASRGRCGIEIDVRRVPRREEGMSPYEVMLSESQERMLLIVKPAAKARVIRLYAKWGLHAVQIGRVTNDGRMRVTDGAAVVADLPVSAITNDAPVYRRPTRRPRYLTKAQQLLTKRLPDPREADGILKRLLASPTIASKAPVYEQYDHMVQTNTVVLPGSADAAVLRLKGTDRLLAATTDGNGRYCYLDPYEGGKLAVAEAARNLVCVGARPLAVTDCLNFGNPEDPEIMWQFKECVRGIAEACRAFGTPVIGGNVSFYNESRRGAIDPTPVIGMVGVIEGDKAGRHRARHSASALMAAAPGQGTSDEGQSARVVTAGFKDEGDAILLLGAVGGELGGSEYLAWIHRRKQGRPPRVDLKAERALHQTLLEAIRREFVKTAHDCSDGGLAVALAECCIMDDAHQIGAAIRLDGQRAMPRTTNDQRRTTSQRTDALLFGESAGSVIVTCEPFHITAIERIAKHRAVPVTILGRVGGRRLSIEPWIDASIEELSTPWRSAL